VVEIIRRGFFFGGGGHPRALIPKGVVPKGFPTGLGSHGALVPRGIYLSKFHPKAICPRGIDPNGRLPRNQCPWDKTPWDESS